MAASARTAPKATGIDDMESLIMDGEDLEKLAATIERKAEERPPHFTSSFKRDANNVRNSSCVLLLGIRGSPWKNGYIESLNGKLRDELLNREIFMTIEEAKVLTEQWQREYNQVRPHSALGYRPPSPEAILSAVMT